MLPAPGGVGACPVPSPPLAPPNSAPQRGSRASRCADGRPCPGLNGSPAGRLRSGCPSREDPPGPSFWPHRLLALFPAGRDGPPEGRCPIFATKMQFCAKNTLILSSPRRVPRGCPPGAKEVCGCRCIGRGGNRRANRVKARGSRRAGRSRIRRPQSFRVRSRGLACFAGPGVFAHRRLKSRPVSGGRRRSSTGSGPDICSIPS